MHRKSLNSRHPPGMRANRIVALAAATLLASSVVSGASARGEEVTTAPSGVTFVSGGISSDAVDRLRNMERDFNLKMVFALTNGEYLSDVRVQVVDPTSRMVLDTLTEGPWLLAKLPAGSYQVNASYGGSTERRTVAVAPASLKTLDFRWSTE